MAAVATPVRVQCCASDTGCMKMASVCIAPKPTQVTTMPTATMTQP